MATRSSIDQMYWGELSPLTRARVILALVVLPVVAGVVGDILWGSMPGFPPHAAGIGMFVAGAVVGVAIRPRKQALR